MKKTHKTKLTCGKQINGMIMSKTGVMLQ